MIRWHDQIGMCGHLDSERASLIRGVDEGDGIIVRPLKIGQRHGAGCHPPRQCCRWVDSRGPEMRVENNLSGTIIAVARDTRRGDIPLIGVCYCGTCLLYTSRQLHRVRRDLLRRPIAMQTRWALI